MLAYTLKRLLSTIPVLILVTLIVFLVMHVAPGDPTAAMLGIDSTEADRAALRTRLGLDRPLWEQYFQWFFGLFRGDLGFSIFMNMPVSQALYEHLMPTLALGVLAQAIAILIALPLGIIAALRKGTKLDAALRSISLLGVAIPSFLLALLLMLVFAVWLRILPVSGYVPLEKSFIEHFRYLVLPSVTLGIVQAAAMMRMTRTSVIEASQLNCINTMRAAGIPERRVVLKHILRNAGLPILTVIGASFASLITGAVIVETIFNIPGIGQLIMNSVARRDYEVIQGALLMIALLLCLINLIVDLLYGAVDRRARLWER